MTPRYYHISTLQNDKAELEKVVGWLMISKLTIAEMNNLLTTLTDFLKDMRDDL